MIPRDAKGRVLVGAVLNPHGRTPGSRNKIVEAFLRDLQTVWEEGGIEMLRRLEKDDPRSVVAACMALVPKSVEVDARKVIYRVRETPMTAEEWQQKFADGGPIVKTGEPTH